MIKIDNLTKNYGDIQAVKGITFTLEEGKIYGFLGANGAGKSTTMNMLTGCLSISDGDIVVDGLSIHDKPLKIKEKIGYLPEIPPLYTEMTPYEYLTFVAEAKKLTKSSVIDEVTRVTKVTSIGDVKDRLIRNLSKGYKQRIGIAAALIGSPKYIILDEPTVGLDPSQIIEMRNLIKSLKSEHTVILSSHILSEVAAICDEVLVISHGKLLASGTPEKLGRLFDDNTVIIVEVRCANIDDINSVIQKIDGITSINKFAKTDSGFELELNVAQDIRDDIFFGFAHAALPIIKMDLQKLSLEEIFIELTSNDTEDKYVINIDNESKEVLKVDCDTEA